MAATSSAPAAMAVGAGEDLRPRLTPQQRRIVEILRAAGGWVSGRALRDALATGAGVKNVHVQVCKLRQALGPDIEIESGHSREKPGYRLVRCSEPAA